MSCNRRIAIISVRAIWTAVRVIRVPICIWHSIAIISVTYPSASAGDSLFVAASSTFYATIVSGLTYPICIIWPVPILESRIHTIIRIKVGAFVARWACCGVTITCSTRTFTCYTYVVRKYKAIHSCGTGVGARACFTEFLAHHIALYAVHLGCIETFWIIVARVSHFHVRLTFPRWSNHNMAPCSVCFKLLKWFGVDLVFTGYASSHISVTYVKCVVVIAGGPSDKSPIIHSKSCKGNGDTVVT